MKTGKSMTSGTPWRLILAFSLPVMLGSVLQQLYNTVDTIIVGNFAGETALSAVGTTGCLGMILIALAEGFSAGAGVVISQLYGAEKESELRSHAASALTVMVVMGLASGLICCLFCEPVLRGFLGIDGEMLDLSLRYFRTYSLGAFFLFGYNIVAAILRSVGDSKATLYFLLTASAVNIVLDLLFVVSFRWSVFGAALATVIAEAVSFGMAVLYMIRRYPIFRFSISELRFDRERSQTILNAGLPMVLQRLIVSFGFIFQQRVINSYGQAMIASFSVGVKIENYLELLIVALQVTMATYAGQNFGAGRIDRIRTGARQALLISLLGTAAVNAVVYFAAPNLVSLFGLSDQAAVYCRAHVRSLCFSVLIFSLYYPIFGLFQGVGKGFIATFGALLILSCRVGAVYVLHQNPLFGYAIIWNNYFIGFTIGITYTAINYFILSRSWRKMQVGKV